MTEIANTSSLAAPAAATPRGSKLKADLRTLAYWISLSAAAGGLGGLVVGGIGGRLAMLLLRFTSPDFIRGMESDDGFTMGRFDFTSTLSLLLVTTVMGSVVGLIVVLGRPFFPSRWMPLAWTMAGAIVGGALLIHTDGVDFNLLEPTWLAIALFVAIPAAGAGLIALFVELLHRVWWRRRGITIAAAIAAVPALIFFPIGIATTVVALIFLVAMQRENTRSLPDWLPTRIAAVAVFAFIVLLGALNLGSDIRELT